MLNWLEDAGVAAGSRVDSHEMRGLCVMLPIRLDRLAACMGAWRAAWSRR